MSPRLTNQSTGLPSRKALTVAGIMSGTSADGIDVAIVRISPRAAAHGETGEGIKLKLLHHGSYAFPRALRAAILAAAGTGPTTTTDLARLNWRLGLAYAETVRASVEASSAKLDLVGCHGQTIYHQGQPLPWLGRTFGCTWQIGEPALIARELGVPVVANFRPADMAQGGQGAPLVPLLDTMLYQHPHRARVLQNLGGIGNLTVVPAGAAMNDVRAFDTGPANMIIDALMQELYGRRYDRNGRIAATGRVLTPVISKALRAPFFRKAPPKSAGREEFGAAYTRELLLQCRRISKEPADAIATATALTAESVGQACERFVLPLVTDSTVDYFVSGGGAKNPTLMRMLKERLEPLGARVSVADAASLPVEAKEAAAFALMAWQTWHHRPGNVPSATGARGPTILGQVCYA